MNDSIDIHAFVSYRHNNPQDIKARDTLKQRSDELGLRLTYDENATQEGDNLIAFMDDLSSARCVFLLLSPDYFKSAYTLYELVSVHEQADLDRRFVQPVRITADMVTYQWTHTKQAWDDDTALRNELARLLGETDHDALWERVDAAWESIVFPYLDELHGALEEGAVDDILRENVEKMKATVQEIVEELTQKLHGKVKTEVERLVKNQQIPTRTLATELRLDPGATHDEDLAKYLVESTGTGKV